jgi:hypothetical protein
MEVKFTKGTDRDFIEARRSDGTIEKMTFPKKGLFPHDAVHLIVERRLRFEHGFWGRIASGANPAQIAAIAKAGGHASSTRAATPAADITELLHAERLVECFEAEMWSGGSGGSDNETFRSILDSACSQSRIPSPRMSDEDIGDIRAELQRTLEAWRELKVGDSLTLAPAWGPSCVIRQGRAPVIRLIPSTERVG